MRLLYIVKKENSILDSIMDESHIHRLMSYIISFKCHIGFHTWHAWIDKTFEERDSGNYLGLGQERRCRKCNKRQLRAVI